MLRLASLVALSLPLIACVAPTEESHEVAWTLDRQVQECGFVRLEVYFAEHVETKQGPCNGAVGVQWMSDDPPLSVELTAVDEEVEPCEGLSSLWCTTHVVEYHRGWVRGELDLTSGTTTLVVAPL